MTAIPSDRLEEEVSRIRWFHRIDLGGGIVTPGVTDPGRNVLPVLGLPERLDGVSVLDVGAWDGFFSFEAERRGASRVLATDSYSWSGAGWGTKAGFELARRVLRSRVDDLDVDVMDLSPDRMGTFDLVLFLGVLYHLKSPLEAVERVANVTGKRLILETEVRLEWMRSAACVVFPGRELSDDPTNWFAFNTWALVDLLRNVGFRDVHVHYRTPWARRLARMSYYRLHGEPKGKHASRRAVIHARR